MLQFLARVNAFFSQILGRAKAFLSDVREFAGRKRKQRAEEAAYYAWERAGRPSPPTREKNGTGCISRRSRNSAPGGFGFVVICRLLRGRVFIAHGPALPFPCRSGPADSWLVATAHHVVASCSPPFDRGNSHNSHFSAFRLSAIRKTPPVTTTSEHLQLPGARKMLFRRLFSSSPSLSRIFLIATWGLAIVPVLRRLPDHPWRGSFGQSHSRTRACQRRCGNSVPGRYAVNCGARRRRRLT